jgi:hypothetical protein
MNEPSPIEANAKGGDRSRPDLHKRTEQTGVPSQVESSAGAQRGEENYLDGLRQERRCGENAEGRTARIGTNGTQWRELALCSSGAVAIPRAWRVLVVNGGREVGRQTRDANGIKSAGRLQIALRTASRTKFTK